MIIVNQNRDEIINFEKMNDIYVSKSGEVRACANMEDCVYVLGEYKTEERAKEVLKDIIEAYRDYRTAECDGYTNVLQETAVFEMPEK